MFLKLKQQALQNGLKLLSNPNIMKLMADPRVMGALMRTIEFRGKVQSDFEDAMRKLAGRLNLVTRDDLSTIEQSVRDLEARIPASPRPRA